MDSQTSQGGPPARPAWGPPGRAAGLNKYAAERTCWQLGPDMAAAVCVVALRVRRGESSWDYGMFPGCRRKGD